MQGKKIYNQPSVVIAEEGDVLVKGPDHVDVAFSPEPPRKRPTGC
jgi:hypothetical protein